MNDDQRLLPAPAQPKTAAEWVQANLDTLLQYAGKWLAIGASGIVAVDSDFDRVFEAAAQQGITHPLVFKVPQGCDGPRVTSPRIRQEIERRIMAVTAVPIEALGTVESWTLAGARVAEGAVLRRT